MKKEDFAFTILKSKVQSISKFPLHMWEARDIANELINEFILSRKDLESILKMKTTEENVPAAVLRMYRTKAKEKKNVLTSKKVAVAIKA